MPATRVRVVRDQPVDPAGKWVLYWMRATRRSDNNYALDRAIGWAKALARPLVVLEALRCDYRWAADRHHAFVIEGMRDNRAAFEKAGIHYLPYVEPSLGHGHGLLAALGRHAAVVITDDYPSFHFPAMLAAAARQLEARLEAIDSIGLLPMRATERSFGTAQAFRRFLQGELPRHLSHMPRADPLRRLELPGLARLPAEITRRWPATAIEQELGPLLAALPIDHEPTVTDTPGGARAGAQRVRELVERRLGGYGEGRNHPDDDGASGLSPYLHFGQVSTHAILRAIGAHHGWTPASLSERVTGAREGWWNLPAGAESFLDELVTWREVGHNHASTRDDLERYDSLPSWARATLAAHADDPREWIYDHARLESADTHDEVWNAAQRQLLRTGTMHNYLRMLWGKKVLEWSERPELAAETLIELNNRWALDGRDPNSYSGIYWVFGRYDRPWGPERPIYGQIRYMTSASTVRKLRMREYLARWSADADTANNERGGRR
ncbi:MAG: deoxyribodipyrimidine photolyase [Deltaproteobacteria bacterium]|nr:deoxyribodipyrimidine photolyase [Nannocystaceae bacterium]